MYNYSNHPTGSLDIPEESFEDDEKTVYTEYTPLGVCGGMLCIARVQFDLN